MNIDFDKITSLLERVTSGGAGEVAAILNPEGKSFTITWKRPRGLLGHESYRPRSDMLLYVRGLIADAGVGVTISMETTQEDFLPED